MRYEIVLAPEAVEDLKRLRAHVFSGVRAAIEEHLRHEPTKTSKSRIKRLRDLVQPQYRLRVGDVRVFFDVEDGEVRVLAVVAKADTEAWLSRKGVQS